MIRIDRVGDDADRRDQRRQDHEGEEAAAELGALLTSRDSTCSQTTRVRRRAGRGTLAPPSARREIAASISIVRDRAALLDLERPQAVDHRARVLARDVDVHEVSLRRRAPRRGRWTMLRVDSKPSRMASTCWPTRSGRDDEPDVDRYDRIVAAARDGRALRTAGRAPGLAARRARVVRPGGL